MSLDFFLPCVPPKATHHAKKIVNVRLRDGRSFAKLADKPELVSAREFWISLLRPMMPSTPIAPPVSLTLELTWPWRSSDPKKLRARFERVPCEVKPDCSNVAKTLEDLLVGLGFIPGDEKVAELVVRKFIGNTPGLRVRIATIGPLWAAGARHVCRSNRAMSAAKPWQFFSLIEPATEAERAPKGVPVGQGTHYCRDCRRVKTGRTIRADWCLGCAHRRKERRLLTAKLIRNLQSVKG